MSELAQGVVMGSDFLSELLAADFVTPENEKHAEKATRAAYAAVNRMRPATKGQRRFFLHLEENDDEYAETFYAFFVFMEID